MPHLITRMDVNRFALLVLESAQVDPFEHQEQVGGLDDDATVARLFMGRA